MRIAYIVLLAFLIVTLTMIFAVSALGEKELIEGWVLCQPDSFIYIRNFPKKGSEVAGYLLSGDHVYLDGKQKRGFMHCVNMSTEAGEGWVAKGYIVYSEPLPNGREYQVKANGRVACRRTVGGDRRHWLRNNDILTVYMVSDEWSLTNEGFVKTEFIDFDSPLDIEEGQDGTA